MEWTGMAGGSGDDPRNRTNRSHVQRPRWDRRFNQYRQRRLTSLRKRVSIGEFPVIP